VKDHASWAVAHEFGPAAFIVYRNDEGEWMTCVPEGPLSASASQVSALIQEGVTAIKTRFS
jgi:hypothetical protein